MESQENIKSIFERFVENECSTEEVDMLLAFLKNDEKEAEAVRMLEQRLAVSQSRFSDPNVKERLRMRLQKILERIEIGEEAPVVPVYRNTRFFNWRRVAAAAIFIFVAGAGAWYLFSRNEVKEITAVPVSPPQDIAAPATTRAMITLADGRQVFLDSAGNGQLAQQGNMKLVKLADGRIAYQMADGSSSPLSPRRGAGGEAAYNTLTNPRGSKVIDMTLSDGSHVWLNAGSSITYPVAFIGNERKVSMTGEAYFEIVPLRGGASRSLSGRGEAKEPFIVQKGDMQVTVLGTHFNINAYDDEESIKVTLLEGSVKTSNSFGDVMLRPGQQAAITQNQKPETRNDIDTEKVMAWKNGMFEFDNAGLAAIMRQVSRWYDVEVVYDRKPGDERFGGGLSKKLPLSEVLKLLEANGVKFILEGRVLRVIP